MEGKTYDSETHEEITLANREPEWYNNPEDVFEPNIDPGLTGDQREQLLDTLQRHRRLFGKKKGLTHLVEHHIDTDGSNRLTALHPELRTSKEPKYASWFSKCVTKILLRSK